jgi:hypothetical protein
MKQKIFLNNIKEIYILIIRTINRFLSLQIRALFENLFQSLLKSKQKSLESNNK